MSPPKLLLFGAAGQTGRYVVKTALEDGKHVIAFVRNPDRLLAALAEVGVDAALISSGLKTVAGNMTDLDAVRRVVRESGLSHANGDAIASVAGKPKSGAVFTNGEPMLLPAVRAIAETMRECGLKRFLLQTGALCADPSEREGPALYFKDFMARVISPLLCVKHMIVDNQRVVPYVYREMNDLEWIVTRPAFLAPIPSKNTEKKVLGPSKKEASPLPFVDLGEWTARAAFDASLAHTAPKFGYVART